MKIGIIQGAFLPVPPLMGGAVEKMWHAVGQAITSKGAEVFHISRAFDGLAAREHQNGVQHIRVRGYETPRSMLLLKGRDLLYSWKAIRALPKCDIVVTNTFWSPVLLPRMRPEKVYVDFSRMPKGQVPFYLKSARIRVPSTAVQTAIVKSCPRAAAITKVIPNPLPFKPGAYDPAQKEERILYTGRIHPEKGLPLLLQAFHVLANEPGFSSWHLDIVGPSEIAQGGGGRDFSDALASEYAHQRIHWHGPVHDPVALNGFYARASVFCYPSLAEAGETFGLAPLEAMAWGCVPVVSSLKCFDDFITTEVNGLVFNHRESTRQQNLASAICRLISTPQLRQQLSTNALAVRQSHSVQVVAGLFWEDFQSLTAGRR